MALRVIQPQAPPNPQSSSFSNNRHPPGRSGVLRGAGGGPFTFLPPATPLPLPLGTPLPSPPGQQDEIYVSSASVISIDAPLSIGSDSGIYNGSTNCSSCSGCGSHDQKKGDILLRAKYTQDDNTSEYETQDMAVWLDSEQVNLMQEDGEEDSQHEEGKDDEELYESIYDLAKHSDLYSEYDDYGGFREIKSSLSIKGPNLVKIAGKGMRKLRRNWSLKKSDLTKSFNKIKQQRRSVGSIFYTSSSAGSELSGSGRSISADRELEAGGYGNVDVMEGMRMYLEKTGSTCSSDNPSCLEVELVSDDNTLFRLVLSIDLPTPDSSNSGQNEASRQIYSGQNRSSVDNGDYSQNNTYMPMNGGRPPVPPARRKSAGKQSRSTGRRATTSIVIRPTDPPPAPPSAGAVEYSNDDNINHRQHHQQGGMVSNYGVGGWLSSSSSENNWTPTEDTSSSSRPLSRSMEGDIQKGPSASVLPNSNNCIASSRSVSSLQAEEGRLPPSTPTPPPPPLPSSSPPPSTAYDGPSDMSMDDLLAAICQNKYSLRSDEVISSDAVITDSPNQPSSEEAASGPLPASTTSTLKCPEESMSAMHNYSRSISSSSNSSTLTPRTSPRRSLPSDALGMLDGPTSTDCSDASAYLSAKLDVASFSQFLDSTLGCSSTLPKADAEDDDDEAEKDVNCLDVSSRGPDRDARGSSQPGLEYGRGSWEDLTSISDEGTRRASTSKICDTSSYAGLPKISSGLPFLRHGMSMHHKVGSPNESVLPNAVHGLSDNLEAGLDLAEETYTRGLLQSEPLYQFYDGYVTRPLGSVGYSTIGPAEMEPDAFSDHTYETLPENSYTMLPSVRSSQMFRQLSSRTSALDLAVVTTSGQRSLWSDLAEVKETGILENITKQERQLQEAMFEVISSEASYLKSLRILTEHFIPGFKKSGCGITENELNAVFSKVYSVEQCSADFLSDLEKLWQSSVFLSGICTSLLTHAVTTFQVYIEYCAGQIYQERVLRRLMSENSKFVEVLKTLESSQTCQSLALHSFLMLPMQRVTRYPLLITAILARLNRDSTDLPIARQCLFVLNNLVTKCNDSARNVARMEELSQIAKQLDFRELKPLSLNSPSRWLVRRGEATRVTWRENNDNVKLTFGKRANRQTLVLFLLTDVLVVTKRKSGERFAVLDYCPRNLVEISLLEGGMPGLPDTNCYPAWLTLLQNHESKTQEMMIYFSSLSEREQWIKSFISPSSQTEDEIVFEEWDCPIVVADQRYAGKRFRPGRKHLTKDMVDLYRIEDDLSSDPLLASKLSSTVWLEAGQTARVIRRTVDGWLEVRKQSEAESDWCDLEAEGQFWVPVNAVREIESDYVRARNFKQRHQFLKSLTPDVINAKMQQ